MNQGNAPLIADRAKSVFSFLMKILLIIVIIFLILWFTGQGSGREEQTTGNNGGGQSFTSGEVANNNTSQGLIPGLEVIREIITPDLQFANQNQLFCSTNSITNTTIGGSNNYFQDAYITNINANSLNIDPYVINSNGITNSQGGDIKLNNNTVVSGGLTVNSGNINITGNLVNFPVNPTHFTINSGVLNLADAYSTGSAYDYRFFPLNGGLDDLSNVNAPSPSSGQALVWNGSAWVAQTVTAVVTGSNGINVSGSDVRLGGTLSNPTTITQAGNAFNVTGGNFNVSGGGNVSLSANNTDITATTGNVNIDANSGSINSNSSGNNIVTDNLDINANNSIYIYSAASFDIESGDSLNLYTSNTLNIESANDSVAVTANGPITLSSFEYTDIQNSYVRVFNNRIRINGVEYFFPNVDGASGEALVTDGLGNLSWASASADADNGLNINGGQVRLGGSLIENTFIDQDGYGLELSRGYFRVDAAYDGDNIDMYGYETSINGANRLSLNSNNIIEMDAVGYMDVDAFSFDLTTDDFINIKSTNSNVNINASNNVAISGNNDVNINAPNNTFRSYSQYADLYSIYDFEVESGAGSLYLRSSNNDVRIAANNGGFYANSNYMGLYGSNGFMISSNNSNGQISAYNGLELTSSNGQVNLENYVQIEDYYITISGVTYYWPFADGTAGQQLTTDGAGGLSWQNAGGGGGGGGGIDGADNGLYMNGTNVHLGGTLIENTTVDLDVNYRLNFTNGQVGFGNNLPINPSERERITISNGGLSIVNPNEFRDLGDWGNGDDVHGIEYKDKYVFLRGVAYNEIHILDISNKLSPIQLPSWPLPDAGIGYDPIGLKVRGNYMYVLASNYIDPDKLYIVDIRDPSDVSLVTNHDLYTTSNFTGWDFAEMDISGDRLYIPAYVSGAAQIDVWNIANPSAPRFCTTAVTTTNTELSAIKVQGERVYWSSRDFGAGQVGVARVSECGVGTTSSTSGPGDRNYNGLDVSGRFMYVTREDGNMDVFNVDDASSINYWSSVFIGDFPRQIKIIGRYAYISTINGGIMKVVDIRDPSSPVFVGNVNIDAGNTDWVIDFEVVGDYIYTARGLQGMHIWDLRGAKLNTVSAGDLATDYLRVENYFNVTNDGQFGGNVSVDKDVSIGGEARFNTRLVSGNCSTASLGVVLCDTFGSLRTHLNTIAGGNSFMLDNVVVGDFSPIGSARLTAVHTTGLPMAVARATNGTLMGFYLGVSQEGSITVSGTTVSYNAFTGSHYAYIDTKPQETLPVGTVARLTGNNKSLHNNPSSEILYGIESSKYENDPRILGAYLSLQDPIETETESNPHLVMATGNGVMWVDEADGTNLQPGDYLISSQISGHAKLDPRTHSISYVIARVAEPVDWSTVSQTVTEGSETKKHKLVSVFYESFARDNGIMVALSQSGWAVTGDDKIQTGYNIIAPKIVSTVGEFSLLSAKAFSVNDGNLVIDQEGNLTTIGAITAPKASIQELAISSLKALGGGITVALGDGESFEIVNNQNEVVLGVSSSGELRADKAAGTGTITAGDTEVTITNPVAKSGSRIIVTPQGNSRVYVKQKANGSFVVAVDVAATDVSFDYLIIN